MQLVKQAEKLYKKLSSDEQLLRLLFYKAKHSGDDVLDESRPDILSNDESLKSGVPNNSPEKTFQIVSDRIKRTRKYDDLKDQVKCRVCVYLGDRDKVENNNLHANQKIIVDCLVSDVYDELDFRSLRIVERVNELLFQERIGFGKNRYEGMKQTELVDNYQCYQLTYSTGGIN
ncbi:hypothetical protein [Bacillus badius]|uniref:hypothetical protein n=1 Tax=Bacillus badius TaxID=1455 RepID=UPI0005972037|nr:hypothetical protein [Bacillus badius]